MATRKTAFATTLPFVADPASITRNAGRQIDWANVPDSYRPGVVSVVVGVAGAAQNATSIPVSALSAEIPSGAVLSFGGAKFARLTAKAVAGATSLTVAAIPTALVSGDTAYYGTTYPKAIPPGTVMCELTSGLICPRGSRPGSETAIGLLEGGAVQDEQIGASTGYGMIVGGVIYENLLPDATGSPKVLPTAYKTELQTAGVGTGFAFDTYSDTTS